MKGTYSIETANEARARWQAKTDANSYHSAVPTNPAHAAGVTAYDLSLGAPFPVSEDDKAYLKYLCAVADWRTDWKDMKMKEDNPDAKVVLEYVAKEQTPGAVALITATFSYFASGVLPADIAVDEIAKLIPPNLIVNHTVAQRMFGKPLS